MPPPKFIFVRHGEAEHNVGFRERGEAAFLDPKYEDAPLTDKGKEQARATGLHLAGLNIVDIWSSPLTRCIETAEELFEETSAQEFFIHDNLVERLGGDHVCNSRKCKRELKVKYPHINMESLPDLPACWSARENEYALRQRMFMLVQLLCDIYSECHPNSHILIVSHADAIFALTGKALKNAEVCIVNPGDL